MANTWYYIGGTYDGYTLKLYVDDALFQSLPYTGDIDSTDKGVVIGTRTSVGTYLHRGRIDEVRIWDQALTADQVKASYDLSAGTEIKEKDLDGDGYSDIIFTSAFYELDSGDTITATILPVDPSVKIDATTTCVNLVTPKNTYGHITPGSLSLSGYSLPITVTQDSPPCKSIHIWLYLTTGDHLGVNAQFLPYN